MARSAELRGHVEEQESIVGDLQMDSEHIGQMAKQCVAEIGFQTDEEDEEGSDIVSALQAEKALLETTVVGLEKKVLDLEKQVQLARNEFQLGQQEGGEDIVEPSVNDSTFEFIRMDDSVYSELQNQLEEYRRNLEEFELVRGDLEGEKEALENLVVDLRRQLKELQKKEVSVTEAIVPELQALDEQGYETSIERPLGVATSDNEQSVNYLERIKAEFVSLGLLRPEEAFSSGSDSEQVEELLLCLREWTERTKLEGQVNDDSNTWTSVGVNEEAQTDQDLSLVRHEVEKLEKDNSILREETEKLIHELEAKAVEMSVLQNQMDDSWCALEKVAKEKRDLGVMINERDEKISELEDTFESQILDLTASKDNDLSLLQTEHEDVLKLLDESRREFTLVKGANEDLLNMIEEKQLANDELSKKNSDLSSLVSTLEIQLESVSKERERLTSQNLTLTERNDSLQMENATLGEFVKENNKKIQLNEERTAEFLNVKIEFERLNKQTQNDKGNLERFQEELAVLRKENKEMTNKLNDTETELNKLNSRFNEKKSELEMLNMEMDKVNELAATRDAVCKDLEHKISTRLGEKEEVLQSLGEKERQIDKVELDLREKGAENDLLRLDVAKLNRALKEKEELLRRQFSGQASVGGQGSAEDHAKLTQMFRLLEEKEQEIDALKQKNTSLVEVVTETDKNKFKSQEGYELRVRTLMEERESLLIEVREKDEELIGQTDRLEAMREKMHSKDQASTMLHGEHSKLLALNESQGNEIAKLRERNTSLQKMLEVRENRISDFQRANQETAQIRHQVNSLKVEHERLSTLVHEKDQQISFLVGVGGPAASPIVPTSQDNLQSRFVEETDVLTRERDSLQREIQQQKGSFSELQTKVDSLTRDLNEENSVASKLKQENVAMKKELADVRSRLRQAEGLQSTWLDPSEARRLENEIEELKRDVEDKSMKLETIKRTLESEKNSVLVDLDNVRSERDIVVQQKDKETTELKNKMLQLLLSVTDAEPNESELHQGVEDIDTNFQALLQLAKNKRNTVIREKDNEIKSLREQVSNLNVLSRTSGQSKDLDLKEALREKEKLHQLLVRTENEKEDSVKEKEVLVADLQDQIISLTKLLNDKNRTSNREFEQVLKEKDLLERDLQRALAEKEDITAASAQKQRELSKLQNDVQQLVGVATEERGNVAGLEREVEQQKVTLQGKDTTITSLMAEREQLLKNCELMQQKVSQLQNDVMEASNEKNEIEAKMARELDRLRNHLVQVRCCGVKPSVKRRRSRVESRMEFVVPGFHSVC